MTVLISKKAKKKKKRSWQELIVSRNYLKITMIIINNNFRKIN